MKVSNATILPKVYFGLHMVEGVAEYKEPKKDAFRILLSEKAIKNMDASFQGKPVYVRHVDDVDLANLQEEADGYVVRSFFNKADGKHWAEFLVVSDKGHDAIAKGWKLSNCYIPKNSAIGGQWHGVDYVKEILDGEYEHLAIVPNPRYAESIIMTPEQFKTYNFDKENELLKIANSKEGEESMLSFFKKQKVENGADLEGMSLILPKSKKEISIVELVKNADEMEMNASAEKPMCNMDHHVQVGEEKMTVNELVDRHMKMKDAFEGKKEEGAEMSEEEKAKKANEEKEAADKKANEEKKAADEKKANEEKEAEEKKKNAANFEKLKNAKDEAGPIYAPKVELNSDRVARGQSRYGSN